MKPIETVRAYVNTWECDENDHLNVQFFFRYFEDAAAQFFALSGSGDRLPPPPRVRHVRYHRELRVDEAVVCHSQAVADAPGRLAHVLRETATGEIAGTALDTFEGLDDGHLNALSRAAGEMPEAVAPRSLDPAPNPTIATAATDFEGGFSTCRGSFRGNDLDRHGRATDQAIIARVSDAATQFWTGIGVTSQWLAERDSGRVAVEMKLTRGGARPPHWLVDVQSRLNTVSRSTVSFEHLIHTPETGEIVAAVETTALTMNLKTRRANRFDDETRAELEARVRAGRIEGAL